MRRDKKNYCRLRRGLDSFSSSVQTERGTRSFPEITTMSIPGSMRSLIRRNASRIFRLARLRMTALPIFLEAMMPSRFLPKPLVRMNRVQMELTRVRLPLAITFSNWGRLANLSLLGNENWLMHLLNSQPFSSFSPSVGQYFSPSNRGTPSAEPVSAFSTNIFWLIRSLHYCLAFNSITKVNPLKFNGLNVDSPACKTDIPPGIISPVRPTCQGRFRIIFPKFKTI